ncbi:MAG: glycosyltransferase, partial [Solirubrobacteraceae bacterium]
MSSDVFVIVAARNEAERIGATLAALGEAFPDAPVWVADDGSSDSTAALAEAAGARVVHSERASLRGSRGVGKGGAVTLAVRAALVEAG